MMMKKTIAAMMVCLTLFAMTGCSDDKKEDRVIDVHTMAQSLLNDITYEDQLTPVEGNMFQMIYGISEEDVTEYEAYVSTGATAEEITVIKAKDEATAEAIEEKLSDRVEAQKSSFASYIPKEVEKLDEAVVYQEGVYVILSISNEDEKAENIIEGK
ncbi:MAG: DUF4358 domain-containing protein [Lachnospiraceae bacterium]|nr:DUF4358 domain-containing protein [Lachnospiraceae bacterium]